MENGGISVAEAINVGLGLTVFVGGIVYSPGAGKGATGGGQQKN